MKIGIDQLHLYSSHYYVDLKTLATERGVDVDKFYRGIGQEQMAVPAPDEDVVTLGANAAHGLAAAGELEDVELLLFATESGIDQSKAAGVFVHRLLGLSERCRTVELKQACYSGTAAVQLAVQYVARHPEKKALVIAADIARYELKSPGEATQGCGAAALIISANPRLLCLEEEAGFYTEDVMDFWRPNYRSEAVVDGKYSTLVYIRALETCWKQYRALSGRSLSDIDFFCYHIPFTKMAEKAHRKLFRSAGASVSASEIKTALEDSLTYSRRLGNCYTASMYVGLASLLEQSNRDLTSKRIGLFSYGSGCVGEFFSGIVQPGYQSILHGAPHQEILRDRTELSYQQYEDIFNYRVPTDGGVYIFPEYRTGPYRLKGINGHKREYESLVESDESGSAG